MRISDLRDWRSCLKSIRQRLDFSIFKAAAGENEEEIIDYVLVLSEKTDQEIAEGMLHTVVSLPQLENASSQLEQFAADLERLQPDPTAGTESGFVAEAYQEFLDEIAQVQRGLPAVVETFKAYAEGRYDLRKESLDVLKEAQNKLDAEPQAALRLVGEAGSLHLRGMEEEDGNWFGEGMQPLKEPLADWIDAVARVVDWIAENLEGFPLPEIELTRDQWWAPDDNERIEYRKGKLARLGIVDPDVQALLLPLLDPQGQRLSEADRKAVIAAGPKVAPGLIAIAGDDDSQMQSSISGGEAAIEAIDLLGDMRAAEAVPTLLEILKNTEWMMIIHDRAVGILHDRMPDLAFDAALEIFDHTKVVILKSEMAGILAKGGQGKTGVFERLIAYFREEKDEQDLIASYLADLGDARALPDLHEAFRRATTWTQVVEFAEAIDMLGGELSAAEEQKLQRLKPRPLAGAVSAKPSKPAPVSKTVPVRVIKIGRNEPCPCGSGKKYKKCCGR